jgi:peptidoglycan/LPS O-acetylase OafA/YrhL
MKPSDSTPAGQSPPEWRYRPDIDGLRAIAVIPVCLFHFGVGPFKSGFAGVDIFFVISGFLMARLIGGRLDKGQFSYLDFYERRVRRIFPALFAMLIPCSVAALFLLPPAALIEFGRSTAATALFASNIRFAIHSMDYFATPTELNPLLHTWSLAVEEQFYVIFPIYLVLIWRTGPRIRWILTGIIAVCSLAAAAWGMKNTPTAAFYLLPSRTWEFLLGAMLSIGGEGRPWWGKIGNRVAEEVGGGVGLLLAIFSLIAFNTDTPFPGLAAMAPCLGAVLLLHFGDSPTSIAGKILQSRPAVFIGKISYSLYLWHWPILVFVSRYILFDRFTIAPRLFTFAVSIGLAVASWRYIERPFRTRDRAISGRRIWFGAGAAVALFALAGYAAEAGEGWSSRLPGFTSVALQSQLKQEAADEDWVRPALIGCFTRDASKWGGDRCFLSRGRATNALIWGDSFANSYAYGLHRSEYLAVNVLQYTSPQCPPILHYSAPSDSACGPFNDNVASVIKKYSIKTIILCANWRSYISHGKMNPADIDRTIRHLRAEGIHVILVGQSPDFIFTLPDEYFYRRFGPNQEFKAFYAKIQADNGLNEYLKISASADEFFDPVGVLCRHDECIFREHGNYIVSDYGHYTHFGSRKMAAALLARTSLGQVTAVLPELDRTGG